MRTGLRLQERDCCRDWGEVAKMQPGAVRSRKAIRFSFCPSDEHRGDS